MRLTSLAVLLAFTLNSVAAESVLPYQSWAPTPPMGWNSWDCFATTVTEAQAKANADVMAAKLKPYGWQYIVVDIQWYEPAATGYNYRKGAILAMDQWGRLLPATNRFPSAADGAGFKALANYVHQKGLKFGIHIMRGIPRQAVAANTPIEGTPYTAHDIADTNNLCAWNTDMYGVDMSKTGAQEYYDSVYQLIASWGVDFVKVDDLSRPYHQAEIEAIRKAIDKTGRPIVFSTSPGATPLAEGTNIEEQANMWRISDDFWDQWRLLYEQFQRLDNWTPYRGPGHFPDADMLPLGAIRQVGRGGQHTHFTKDEQIIMMSLWSIARSPLIMGGDLTKLDDFTSALLTNAEVIAVDQHSSDNHQLFRRDGAIAWIADAPHSGDKYLALFNTTDAAAHVPVDVAALGLGDSVHIRDLWKQADIVNTITDQFAPTLPAHGAGLYRVCSIK
jgi:alpha-galactosidase